MELILPVLSSTISYFFLSYFIYIISGRKKGLTQGILYVLALIMLYQNVIKPWNARSTPQLIYAITISIVPPLLSLLLLRYLMGDLGRLNHKFKRTKLKGIKELKDTIDYQMKFVYLALTIPLALSFLAYFTLESFLFYATLLLSISVLIYGIMAYFKLSRIKNEILILLIGKDKEHIYIQNIKPKTLHIDIKTYFKNDLYLIDQLGIIDLMYEKKTIRHHLYWIGTSDKVLIEDLSWEKVQSLPYQDDLISFEKYHYIHATYQMTDHDVKRVQFKRIK